MRQKDATDYDADLAAIEKILGGPITGKARYEVMDALDECREGVFEVAKRCARNPAYSNPAAVSIVSLRNGSHKQRRKLRAMSTDETTGTARRERIPAAEALRRLYDAKVEHLRRCGVPEAESIPYAIDYACSEIHRCDVLPMGPGGLGKLEDDLYRAVGFDRLTGIRGAPLEPRT